MTTNDTNIYLFNSSETEKVYHFGTLMVQSKLFKVDDVEDRMEFNLDHCHVERPFGALVNSTLVNDDMQNISATIVLIKNLTAKFSSEYLLGKLILQN